MINQIPHNLDEFIMLCNECDTVQQEVLFNILHSSADTEIGKRFDFGSIKDIDTYRERVSTTTWKNVAPYAERIQHGESDLLFPGAPSYFICTSGTTGGVKIIPESEKGKVLKSLTGQLRLEAIRKKIPELMQGKILPLVNHAIEGYTPSGLPYGSASGITLATAPEPTKKIVAFPMTVLDIDYGDIADYALMRFSIAEDVYAIFGNNAGRITQFIKLAEEQADNIISDIEHGTLQGFKSLAEEIQHKLKAALQPNPKRAEELRRAKKNNKRFLPDIYWPRLKIVGCWLSSSVGQYTEELRALLSKNVLFFDVGYGATEGKFNIPLEPEQAFGPLTIYAGFYEFLDKETGNFLLASEVKQGKSYELYVTNYSGLYRYAMGDIVRVEKFLGSTPEIFFEQKTADIINLCGEKVAASTLIPSVAAAVSKVTGHLPVHWCIVPDTKQKRYHFYIESAVEIKDIKKIEKELALILEKLLIKNTFIYPIFRKQNLIKPLQVFFMRAGWQNTLYIKHGASDKTRAQIKLPLVYDKVPAPEFIFNRKENL